MVEEIVNLASQFPYPQGQPTLPSVASTTGATYAHVAGSVDPAINQLLEEAGYNTRVIGQLTADPIPAGVTLWDLAQADWSLQQQITELREGQAGIPTDINIENQLSYKADLNHLQLVESLMEQQGAEIDTLNQQIANLNAAIGQFGAEEGFSLDQTVLGDAFQAAAFAGNLELEAGVAKAFYDSEFGRAMWNQGNWLSGAVSGMNTPFEGLQDSMAGATGAMNTGAFDVQTLSNEWDNRVNSINGILANLSSKPLQMSGVTLSPYAGQTLISVSAFFKLVNTVGKLITWGGKIESLIEYIRDAFVDGVSAMSALSGDLGAGAGAFSASSNDFGQLKSGTR